MTTRHVMVVMRVDPGPYPLPPDRNELRLIARQVVQAIGAGVEEAPASAFDRVYIE